MTLADDLKPVLRQIRGIPGQLGLRPHRVFLAIRRWSSTCPEPVIGDGSAIDIETELLEGTTPPKVRQLSDERLALASLPSGSIEIGPITASHAVDDPTASALRGVDLNDLETLRIRISGPVGNAIYRISKLSLDRAMHWRITAEPMSNAGP